MNPCDQQSLNILRYIDYELDGSELDEFRTHLRTCADCRDLLEREQSLSNTLRRSRPLYSAPHELRDRLASLLAQGSSTHWLENLYRRFIPLLSGSWLHRWPVLTPTAIAIFVLCLIVAPLLVQQVRAASYVESAAATHRSYLGGRLSPEYLSDSPEAVTAWFEGKVPFQFRLPDSDVVPGSTPIYRLVGARVIDFKGAPAALVIFRTQREQISLLATSSRSAIVAGGERVRYQSLTFHYHNLEGLNVITWSSHDISYALVSSTSGSAQGSCMVCHQNMADHGSFGEPVKSDR